MCLGKGFKCGGFHIFSRADWILLNPWIWNSLVKISSYFFLSQHWNFKSLIDELIWNTTLQIKSISQIKDFNSYAAKYQKNKPYLSINDPFGQKRIITGRTNWSKPRFANLFFKLIHTYKFCKPCIHFFFFPSSKPAREPPFKCLVSHNSTVTTVAIKYTTCYTYNLHNNYSRNKIQESLFFSGCDHWTYSTILKNCKYCRSPSSHTSNKSNIPEAKKDNVENKKKQNGR